MTKMRAPAYKPRLPISRTNSTASRFRMRLTFFSQHFQRQVLVYILLSTSAATYWKADYPLLPKEVCPAGTGMKRYILMRYVLYVGVALDILTDVLLMFILILLLWSVKINLRWKIGLISILCLGIFVIVTNIIRASGHYLNTGRSVLVWVVFWAERAGCFALIASPMTAFRSLWVASTSRIKNLPQKHKKLVEHRMRYRKQSPHVDLPTLPTAKLSGLQSFLLTDPSEDHETMESDGV
ncbi:hypothetical protein MMC29_004824 [Sticta canariensis]|nr:hypothetical protein [Sticta canariensis]